MLVLENSVKEKNSITLVTENPLPENPGFELDPSTFTSKDFPPSKQFIEESGLFRFGIIVVALITIGVSLGYLAWRTLDTINLNVWWISLPLLLLEFQAFLSLLLFIFSLWDVNYLRPARKVSAFEGKIAVLIPTYNEGIEVLLPTVTAALALTPAHQTWILDDGDRPEIEAMALSLGAIYLTRPDHSHAKAGNINHALEHIDADFIAIFDADHVASPDFLTNTLGYFDDPEVALVQTPQDFYNQHSFEHITSDANKPRKHRKRVNQAYHEQALFYRVIQAGKNRWNGAFWCGTNAVIRLSSLKAIGGLATETITEDIHTSIRFHRGGWKTVYHNEVLARGLAAATASQFQLQRYRWGTGAMQVLRKENPLFVSGLTIRQRLAYAATLLGWFDAWRTLFYLLMPPIVLITGAVPILADPIQFLEAFLLNYFFQQWSMVLLGRGMHKPISGTIFELVRMTPNIRATLTIFKKGPQRFSVTPKGRTGQHRQRIAPPRILLWVLASSSLAGFIFLLNLIGFLKTYSNVWVAYGAFFWLIFNSGLVWLAIKRVKSISFASEVRRSVRFSTDLAAGLGGLKVRIQNVSLTGVRLVTSLQITGFAEAFQKEQVHILVTNLDHTNVTLKVVIKSIAADSEKNAVFLGCEFLPGQFQERSILSKTLFNAPELVDL
jgi:cellulose synthase/poly-beta-1,6-N-acetylglucosamine synthase-like glycosyltransferase